MGSENSTLSWEKKEKLNQLKRQLRKSRTESSEQPEGSGVVQEPNNDGTCSPQHSVCSDTDVPFISYTVNKPIGDSPKFRYKFLQRAVTLSGASPVASPKPVARQATVSKEIHIVNKGKDKVDVDPDIARFQDIPSFLPIMQLGQMKDSDILERLDHRSVVDLCRRYQEFLYHSSQQISSEQDSLSSKIKELDGLINAIMAALVDRQKKYAKYAEKLSHVSELSKLISRCQDNLHSNLQSIEELNQKLPPNLRLEPFEWTSG